MTELIFDLDGRAVTIRIVAPEQLHAPWLLSASWDDEHGSGCGTAVVHEGAAIEDFSHRGVTRIVRRIARRLRRTRR